MIAKPGDRGPQIEGPELLETLADKTGGSPLPSAQRF